MYATIDSLKYNGDIERITFNAEIPWTNYNPSEFISNTLLSGDVSKIRPPMNDMDRYGVMTDTFNLGSQSSVKNLVVESEVVEGMKFVVIDEIKNIKSRWVEA